MDMEKSLKPFQGNPSHAIFDLKNY